MEVVTMVDLQKIPSHIVDDIAANMDLDTCNEEHRARLARMSPEELMDKFLNWQGIIGYTDMIINTYKALKGAESK
jgi:hypothetical protein